MEVLIEIPNDVAARLHIDSAKLTFEELRRKIAVSELGEALKESHKAARLYGIDQWTIEDINNMIMEANYR